MGELSKAGWVFLGAGTGAVVRYFIQQVALRCWPVFTWANISINVVGSFLIGVYLAWEGVKPEDHIAYRPLVAIGLLGGFTTFSAFSAETIRLLQQGEKTNAFLYIAGSVSLSIIGCWLGLRLGEAGFR